MPSILSNTPFRSLRPDGSCGREEHSVKESNGRTSKPFQGLVNNQKNSQADGHTDGNSDGHAKNGHLNGHNNGSSSGGTNDNVHHEPEPHHGQFLRLEEPQQDILLLHGPRQKYSLAKAQDIPTLKSDREILVQVLAVGLNPVDWKGADYDFGQPRYPWVNGRDFAGIVVRAPREEKTSRIRQGDIVFGPSTDYRDVRKATYQEYLVTTDYNVARVPQNVQVEEAASIGVAYAAAVIGLGVSLGTDFTNFANAPIPVDLLRLTRSLSALDVSKDIHHELFSGISNSDRPRSGEWLAIWGASTTTGQVVLQLAKAAGLKVAAVFDVAKTGGRISELGADLLVDRRDAERAVEIIRAVTGGKLRFAIDCVGKESAAHLQELLQHSASGLPAHLLGLTGLPKEKVNSVIQHNVPIKVFHEAPIIGEILMKWLEELLSTRTLKLPEVEIGEGGLAGINDALDRLRSGTVSGKRIVVPVDISQTRRSSGTFTPSGNGGTSLLSNGISHDLSYHEKINSDPDRLKFAYWVPNVSGGMVISKIPQRTSWDLKSNQRYARTAERVGFEYALSQIRFMAGYGADNQHEPVTFSQALLHSTEKLKLIAALLPGPWNPAVAAKQIASIDNYTDGRIAVNIVSGWFKAEFTSIGQWWLDHAERYRRSREFIECLKGIWTNDKFNYKGDFYQFHDYPLKPKPLSLPGRPWPEIFQGGNSIDARENAAHVSDYYFMNGNTLEGFQEQIRDVKERADKAGRHGAVKFALNSFVICRETEEEAIRVLKEIQGKADKEAVEGFRAQVQNAGSSTANKTGMWADSKFEDLVQYNDGFKTKLIGTKEQIVDRILLLKSLGVDILLTAFLHYEDEIQQFGDEILPRVRELEKQGRGKDEGFEVRLTGDVYRKRETN